ncbi:hypothetical protein IMZ48_02580 [Candidatus Bathyarchaeota archaeon]|nr:hypothetical protein [Candidatus Bathyarchaeota archaeon]
MARQRRRYADITARCGARVPREMSALDARMAGTRDGHRRYVIVHPELFCACDGSFRHHPDSVDTAAH